MRHISTLLGLVETPKILTARFPGDDELRAG
jgi:hypothetical protein